MGHELNCEVGVEDGDASYLSAFVGAAVAVDGEQHPRFVAGNSTELGDPVEQCPGFAEFDFDDERVAVDVVGFFGRFGSVSVGKPVVVEEGEDFVFAGGAFLFRFAHSRIGYTWRHVETYFFSANPVARSCGERCFAGDLVRY